MLLWTASSCRNSNVQAMFKGIQTLYLTDVRIDLADGGSAGAGGHRAGVVEVGAVFGAGASAAQCD